MSKASYWTHMQSAYRSRRVIWLIAGLVVSIIVWASLATVDEVVVGTGKVVPTASVQRVQSLDGGVLRELHVKEGDVIATGQLLATLDETRAKASFSEAREEELTLRAKRARLIAQLDSIEGNHIVLKEIKADGTEHFANEVASYFAEINELRGRIKKAEEDIIQQERDVAEARNMQTTLTQSLKMLDKELVLTRKAVDVGALSSAELRKLERERIKVAGHLEAIGINLSKLGSMVVESEQARGTVFDEFRTHTQTDLSATDSRLARITQYMTGLSSQLEHTKIHASMGGTVKSIAINSIGGVVLPGETIMEIVPLDDRLLIEARIPPKDIARLQANQEAIVKFDAYDFVIFGGMKGVVVQLSPDALMDEHGVSYYGADITAKNDDWKDGLWQGKPIIPGMQAEVDILTGKKTVLQYWLKPLLRARANALREP